MNRHEVLRAAERELNDTLDRETRGEATADEVNAAYGALAKARKALPLPNRAVPLRGLRSASPDAPVTLTCRSCGGEWIAPRSEIQRTCPACRRLVDDELQAAVQSAWDRQQATRGGSVPDG